MNHHDGKWMQAAHPDATTRPNRPKWQWQVQFSAGDRPTFSVEHIIGQVLAVMNIRPEYMIHRSRFTFWTRESLR